MVGFALIILGVLLWGVWGFVLLGLIAIIVGVALLFAPVPGVYGYSHWRNHRRRVY